MSKDVNKRLYKNLKAKKARLVDSKSVFKEGINNTKNRLYGNVQQQPKSKEKTNYDELIKNMEKNYSEKLSFIQKDYTNKLSRLESKNKSLSDTISSQFKNNDERFAAFSNRMNNILKGLSKQQSQQSSQQQTQQKESSAGEEQQEQKQSQYSKFNINKNLFSNDINNKKAIDVVSDIKEEKKEDVVKNIETSLIDNSSFDISSITQGTVVPVTSQYSYKLTNLFGPRTGSNAVVGRKGEHSRGIDIRLVDRDGNNVDLPIAIADGTIVGVYLQGSGKKISTLQGREAGYYVDVKLDGSDKIVRYMHLGPKVMDEKDSLIGKKIKRGDLIIDDNRSTGSVTANHIKVSIYTPGVINEKGKLDYTKVDPTKLLITGKLD